MPESAAVAAVTPVVRVAALPYAVVVSVSSPVVPRRRYFVAWAAAGRPTTLLGQAVVDEFQTLSSPVFFVPRALAGKVYDLGLKLAFERDPELPLDGGWPPLVVGLPIAAASLPADWAERLRADLAGPTAPDPGAAGGPLPVSVRSLLAGAHVLTLVRIAATGVLVATDAPLLPRQLRRLAASLVSEAPGAPAIAVALGTGSHLDAVEDGTPQDVAFLGEAAMAPLLAAASALASSAGRLGPGSSVDRTAG